MATKERNQNNTPGDTVVLRLFTLNSNTYTNIQSIDEINIYYLDPTAKTEANPTGKTLFQTLDVDDVVNDSDGHYSIEVELTSPLYVIGNYIDAWSIIFDDSSNEQSIINNCFQIYSNLWIAAEKPLIYDFDFKFSPNRITQGSIKYLTVNIIPLVPRGTTLEKYYENLAITSNVTITIIQRCGSCLPKEEDLRMIIEDISMDYKDRNKGYYLLDTTDMDCGIYDIIFKLTFGDTTHVSTRGQLEIFT